MQQRPASMPALTDREMAEVSAMIYAHCGITLGDKKRDLVRARLGKLIRNGGFGGVTAYLEHVKADATGQAMTELTDAISTNLTQFFREPQHFDYLRNVLLPSCRTDRPLRAWSAGCSTGEEPYSLAMTLAEWGGPWLLLATDISTRVLKQAASGRYGDERIGGIPPERRNKFLKKLPGGGWEVDAALRASIRFRYFNLMQQAPFQGPFEFIFCRNVMIYFDKPTQTKLVTRFAQMLVPGGCLFTGHSESLAGIDHGMRCVQPTVYRRAGGSELPNLARRNPGDAGNERRAA